jgi:large subunit ribosomal protein L6
MSRIGKKPVAVPAGVKVAVHKQNITVEGPKGKLALDVHPLAQVAYDDQQKTITVTRPNNERLSRAIHGLTRSLISNMVLGVSHGFEKRLKIEGIGYQARMEKHKLLLTVGFSHPIDMEAPAGVLVELPDPTTIIIKGADKQLVGQFAAEVRRARPPEPYKGKGIRYENEVVRRKEGKTFASASA